MKRAGRHPERTLTVIKVKQERNPGRYADGNGLYLLVDPTGARRWLLRIVINGKRCDLGLGSAGLVSLADAREKAASFRKIARQGGGPRAERQVEVQTIPTFADAAARVHAEHELGWKNPKHAQQWLNTLKQYVFPTLGATKVDAIDTPDVLKVLAPIWLTKPETARRVKQRIGTVMDWVKASGFRAGENPVEGVLRGLSKQGGQKEHYEALPFAEASRPGARILLRGTARSDYRGDVPESHSFTWDGTGSLSIDGSPSALLYREGELVGARLMTAPVPAQPLPDTFTDEEEEGWQKLQGIVPGMNRIGGEATGLSDRVVILDFAKRTGVIATWLDGRLSEAQAVGCM